MLKGLPRRLPGGKEVLVGTVLREIILVTVLREIRVFNVVVMLCLWQQRARNGKVKD